MCLMAPRIEKISALTKRHAATYTPIRSLFPWRWAQALRIYSLYLETLGAPQLGGFIQTGNPSVGHGCATPVPVYT